jgi:hypothetical protein
METSRLNREAIQLSVGRAIETDALPYYRKPFPRSPRARDQFGCYRRLAHPFFGFALGQPLEYSDYIRKVQMGLRPPRSIHGPVHAARVALWAGLLSVLLERFGLGSTHDLFVLQMAAAFHDAGRQDEGIDRWEPESERIFMRWYRRAHAGAEQVPICPAGIAAWEQAILKDADTLDILRVLPSLGEFNAERLSWCNDERIPGQIRRSFIQEVYALIRLTEQAEIKRELEDSGALYFRLMHLLVQFQRESMCWPLLDGLVKDLAGQA